jgi:hypothetical protein
VNQYFASLDYVSPAAYSIFRYQSTSMVSGSSHQLTELEFFGTAVPEPGVAALFALGAAALSRKPPQKKGVIPLQPSRRHGWGTSQ